jgi:lactoylglutathione lyase
MKFAYTILYVHDVESTLNFYIKAFGCTMRFLDETKAYGELETGNTTLAFASESLATSNVGTFEKNNLSKDPAGFEIAFITDNVQHAYEHALNSGAQALQSPAQKPWGQLVAYVLDINGIIIEICSPLS